MYKSGVIQEAACMAHARRKIYDTHIRHPSPTSQEALKRIGELYTIEAKIRGQAAEDGRFRVCRRGNLFSGMNKRAISSVRDEGRPLEVGFREQASNHLKLRWLRARVVSVEEKPLLKALGKDQKDE